MTTCLLKVIASRLKNAAALPKGIPYNRADKPKGSTKRIAMKSVACLCLQLFGEGNTPEIKDDLETIAAKDLIKLDWKNPPENGLYAWYYATQAMFQQGGKNWDKWNRKFQKVLTGNQSKEGYWNFPGSSNGIQKMDLLTSRVYATTLCALQLTVYYRYLPSSKGATGNKTMTKVIKPVIEEGLDLVD